MCQKIIYCEMLSLCIPRRDRNIIYIAFNNHYLYSIKKKINIKHIIRFMSWKHANELKKCNLYPGSLTDRSMKYCQRIRYLYIDMYTSNKCENGYAK